MTDERSPSEASPSPLARIDRFLNSSTGVGTVILAMALGMFVWQPWGWLISALLVWVSPRWSMKSKLITTAIVPGSVLLTNLVTSLLGGMSVGYTMFIVLASPIVSAVYLWRSALPARSHINS